MTKAEGKILWGLLRKLAVKRDGAKCLRCGKGGVLHCSHIYPRGEYPRMAYELDNVKMLCFKCHLKWWHKNIVNAYKWYVEVIPAARRRRLASLASKELPPLDFNKIKTKLCSLMEKS